MEVQAKQSYTRHYMVVAACAILATLGVGIPFSAAPIFFAVVPDDIGVPLSALSLWMTINGLLTTAILPTLGKLMAKLDARVILSASLALIAAALFVFSLGKSGDKNAVYFFYAGALFMAPGTAFPVFLAVPTLINRWFTQRAATFLGIAMAFTGVGGVIFNPLGQSFINSMGWQGAYKMLAVIILAGIPFMWLLVRNSPQDVGLLPYGAELTASEDASAAPTTAAPVGVSQSIATKSLAFKMFLILAPITYIGVTFYQLLAVYAKGLPIAAAAAGMGAILSSFAMAGQAVGKIGLGLISDKSIKLGSTVSLVCGLISLLIMWLMPVSPIVVYIAGFLFGWYYAFALVQLPSLARTAFGVRDFAQIYSKIGAAGAFASAIALPLLSLIREKLGGFPILFIIVIAIIVISYFVFMAALKNAESLEHTTA